MNAAIQELRRPWVYAAAVVVGVAAALAGLPWFADAAIAVTALFAGAAAAIVVSGRRGAHEASREPIPPTRQADSADKQTVALFRREGDYWTIATGEATVRLQDAKGLRYIHRLLASPGVEVHVLDLTLEGQTVGARTSPDALGEEVHADQPSRHPILDAQARRELRQRIEDLREEVEEANANADHARSSRAKDELDAILGYLKDAMRPDGSSGSMPDETERARVNVSRAIRSSIRKIEGALPSLGHHLDREIRTGAYCCYEPDPAAAPTWLL